MQMKTFNDIYEVNEAMFRGYIQYSRILTIVNNPEHREEIKSLPAREVTIVLWAPDTAERKC